MSKLIDLARKTIWATGGVAAAKLLMGIAVPLPDERVITESLNGGGRPLLWLYNLIGGGALAQGSAFALGIMPYLSARAFLSLARHVSPEANGLSGTPRKWWTRGLTVGLSMVQSFGYALYTQNVPGAVSQPGPVYVAETMLMLTTVSTLLLLFCEEATGAHHDEQMRTLPRERAETLSSPGRDAARDPLYVSHPTPAP